ncbi:MAG: hypothetical protein ACK5H4_12055 [Lacrimispora sphenoides]
MSNTREKEFAVAKYIIDNKLDLNRHIGVNTNGSIIITISDPFSGGRAETAIKLEEYHEMTKDQLIDILDELRQRLNIL